MLPLPVFDHHKPRTLPEAIDLLARLGDKAVVIAGGTDVLPNMKQGLATPEHVVSIAGIEELRGISLVREGDDDKLVLGAGARLAEIESSILVRRIAPALAEAAGQVGGPHHRAMGTLGGNICLDTRCRYYNQTYFWRKSLGFCLKKDGTVCHVVRGGSRCVAAASNDTAPALIALEADIHLLGPRGARIVTAHDFYVADGVKNTVLEPGELVVRVSITRRPARRSSFEKLRRRNAIDFPLLSIAVRLDVSGVETTRVDGADVVVSALGARPRRVRAASKIRPGTPFDVAARELAEGAYAECKPLPNVDDDTEWRREMVPALVERAVTRLEG
ncbi:FAD binding domain-containing protein [Polyangium sp. y55x31]|uniref:FAD binding domain-containing protein n=1 Tax=Polyangium sp. y55x31 TaxID=3042688 RepID=UPI0024827E55|nr:FAD binding domain-containing protein [Polyangium sp. y55x31]MDI1478127.1 FAD binding domain-containing protein [Polyangium sp. y55x31]